jgi:hypothetical protein
MESNITKADFVTTHFPTSWLNWLTWTNWIKYHLLISGISTIQNFQYLRGESKEYIAETADL